MQILAGFGLNALVALVRRATRRIVFQRRSVHELALLNAASRALIHSELDVDALCEQIYCEASKIVDTSSFHLGLFDGDHYTLVIRVQDRVRLPPVSFDLSAGDGLIGWIRQTGTALLVEDFLREMEQLPARPRYQSARPPRSGVYVPLIAGSHVIGSISIQSYQPHAFGANDLRLLSLIADQAAVVITRARAYRAQQEEAWTLNALLQVAEQIGQTNSLDEWLATAVEILPRLIAAPRCYVLLWESAQAQFHLRAAYGVDLQQNQQLRGTCDALASQRLLSQLHTAEARIITITGSGQRQAAWPCLPPLPQPHDGSLVALPLRGRSGLLGALLLDYDDPVPPLDPLQTSLCVGSARQVATALESLLLTREAEFAARLEEELRVAREIQTALLPATTPKLPGWQIEAAWRSARIVGGDFFDFWRLEERQTLGFVIADVSDKGVPAALFMAMARSLVRAAALDGSPPDLALTRANRWISRDSESGMFVTIFYAILDPASGQLDYCVAGHNPPLHYRAADATLHALRTPGIALGVLDEVTLHAATTHLAPDDILVCYTDGVTEAIDEEEHEFGVERLRTIIQHNHRATAAKLKHTILSALAQHSHGQPTFDDVTLVILKRSGNGML
ncbi:MAG: GAF domain-containing protein [Candidatus Viridilinea halotolerans]|uniref:GAF domain-containing protein n=1 Tax=Candidatus Viridilinea halotolerans TaxID=2491704 RepID=A0A426U057_9CHLR|nr:MAG: GAF domain-containing protein [Candidatus Viridilinea halotolerans]